jgi:hypothetical protein
VARPCPGVADRATRPRGLVRAGDHPRRAGGVDPRWGWAHRLMTEDRFLDLRVVQQIRAGNGPVFNEGERVGAFTGGCSESRCVLSRTWSHRSGWSCWRFLGPWSDRGRGGAVAGPRPELWVSLPEMPFLVPLGSKCSRRSIRSSSRPNRSKFVGTCSSDTANSGWVWKSAPASTGNSSLGGEALERGGDDHSALAGHGKRAPSRIEGPPATRPRRGCHHGALVNRLLDRHGRCAAADAPPW